MSISSQGLKKHKVVADEKIPGVPDLLANRPEFDLTLLPLSAMNARSLRDADILIGRSVLRVNADLLENTAVRMVATASSGVDHVDQLYLAKRGIPLLSAPGSNAQGVADYMLWMMAYLTKQGCLQEKTAGIIGVGHVGSKVHSILNTLGFEVLLNDPPKGKKTALRDIAQCDVICVHAALSKEPPFPSYHLLSKPWFLETKKQAVLINAARGAIIDTAALLEILPEHSLQLCLDVYENEPHVNKALMEQCLMVTPHIAGHTVESFYRATQMIVDAICHKLNIPPSFPLNKGEEQAVVYSMAKRIDARACERWYDVILQLYPFDSTEPLTAENFYALRESHRLRRDFSTKLIQLSSDFPAKDRQLLQSLNLNLQEIDHAVS